MANKTPRKATGHGRGGGRTKMSLRIFFPPYLQKYKS